MSEKDKKNLRPSVHHGGPGGAIGRPVEKAKNFKGTLKRLIRYLKPFRINLVFVLIFAVLSTIFTIWSPKISGNAMNKLTNGFIAKTMVTQVSKAQKTLTDQIDKLNSTLTKTQNQVESKVRAEVKSKFDSKMQQALDSAVAQAQQKAKAEVKKQFDLKIQAQKQQAESQAAAMAKAEVLKKFQAMQSRQSSSQTAVSQQAGSAQAQAALQAAQDQAAAAAIAAVDQKFAQQEPQLQQTLAAAQSKAAAAAKAAVENAMASQQSAALTQLAQAQDKAATAAKNAVHKQFLEKAKMTQKQYDVMQEMAGLTNIADITDANQKADTLQKFINLSKQLPDTGKMKKMNVSQTELDKGIKDIRETNGKIPFGEIKNILFFLLGIYLLSSIFTFVMQFVMTSVTQKTVYTLRKEVDGKLARLPLKYFDTHTNGEILSRMTNDIDTISSTLQQSLTQLIQAVMQIIGYTIMMLTYSPILTLIVIATLPLYIFVTMFVAKHSQKFYAAQQKHLGDLSGHTEEMYTGHKIVKAFGHEKDSIKTFEAINDDLYKAGWKAQFMSGVMYPMMNFISNIGYVVIAVVGGIFVTKNKMNIGDITAFIQYSRSFSMPITQTANIANIIQSTIACAERVFEVLDEKEEIPDSEDAAIVKDPQGNIKFNHVQFSYKENEPLIEDMNLDIKKGETVAIVGPTGAGKTTLVNLLMRFYELQNGSITFDGIDIRTIQRGNLRTMFGMVLQDTWLFNGTIRENIAYGRDNSTENQIVDAAKAAHADHFIRSLPEGYDTVLNEEASNISQGQKQLLTIARAILADPSVLILDEATSSVDTRTELLIQHAMGILMKGRTNFVIAHRLSTIRDAHMILVMNNGTIIEKGNHAELLEKGGFYADLYNSQFTGASIDEKEA